MNSPNLSLFVWYLKTILCGDPLKILGADVISSSDRWSGEPNGGHPNQMIPNWEIFATHTSIIVLVYWILSLFKASAAPLCTHCKYCWSYLWQYGAGHFPWMYIHLWLMFSQLFRSKRRGKLNTTIQWMKKSHIPLYVAYEMYATYEYTRTSIVYAHEMRSKMWKTR